MKRMMAVVVMAGLASGSMQGQVPATAATGQASSSGQDAGRARTYDVLQPSVTTLLPLLDTLRVDKWKAAAPVRDVAFNNVASIRRDLQETLPPLIQAADRSPGSVGALLAVSRNVDALYDVVLRVDDTAEIAGPPAQSGDLAQALSGLLAARRTLGEMVKNAVAGQEQQVKDLQKSLSDKTAAAAVAAAPPVCPTTPPAKATKKKVVPAKKPVTSQ